MLLRRNLSYQLFEYNIVVFQDEQVEQYIVDNSTSTYFIVKYNENTNILDEDNTDTYYPISNTPLVKGKITLHQLYNYKFIPDEIAVSYTNHSIFPELKYFKSIELMYKFQGSMEYNSMYGHFKKYIKLPEGLKYMGYEAVCNTSIEYLIFPTSFKGFIYDNAVENNNNLKVIIFTGNNEIFIKAYTNPNQYCLPFNRCHPDLKVYCKQNVYNSFIKVYNKITEENYQELKNKLISQLVLYNSLDELPIKFDMY